MKKIFNFKSILALGTLAISSLSIAQEEIIPTVIERPVYEELGVSPTVLFTIMLSLTIVLIIVLVGVSNSTSNVFKFKHSKAKKTGLLVLFGLFSSSVFASSPSIIQESEYFMNFPDSAFWAFFILDIVIVMLILYFVALMKGALSDYKLGGKQRSIFSKWNKSLTNAVEIEDEDSILMDHDYDGIHELDNDLPPWWKYGFYITIVWGVGYFFYYQVFEIGNLQEAEYVQEMVDGDKEVAAYKAAHPNLVNEDNVELLTDASAIGRGKTVYDANCVACHAGNGGGGIGPNLTDNAWIYNYDIKGIFHTVSEGAENGMIAWKEMLSPAEIQEVSSYVLSMPLAEGGKDPQGEKISE